MKNLIRVFFLLFLYSSLPLRAQTDAPAPIPVHCWFSAGMGMGSTAPNLSYKDKYSIYGGIFQHQYGSR
jgi:hypothetical protein